MGDLMHALPALTEAKENVPEASFDWVVDKNFQSVPQWHPAVKSTLVTIIENGNWTSFQQILEMK